VPRASTRRNTVSNSGAVIRLIGHGPQPRKRERLKPLRHPCDGFRVHGAVAPPARRAQADFADGIDPSVKRRADKDAQRIVPAYLVPRATFVVTPVSACLRAMWPTAARAL
jgi:hypothetical protein